MGILQKLGFKSATPQIVSGKPLPPVTINYSRRMITSNESDIKEIYKNSSIIQTCLNIWQNEFGAAPLKPYIMDKPYEAANLDIFNHSVCSDILYHMLTSGTSFIYKIRNDFGHLVSVQILSGFYVTKEYDRDGNFSNWIYKTSKGEFKLEMNDIVALPWFTKNPDDIELGLSPISSIMLQAEQINELQRFVTDLASNDFVPRTILTAPPNLNLTNTQQQQILDQVREEFQTNPGSIKVLNGGWSIERLSLGMQDLDTKALRIVPETDIASAFMIPPTVLHSVAGAENSTYNNVETARKQFIMNTVAGLWSKVEQVINENFSYEFGSNPEWHFEYANLPSMQEDADSRFARLQGMFQANVISRAEFRSEMDLDDIDNGEQVYFTELQNAIGGFVESADYFKSDPAPDSKGEKKNLLTKSSHKR